MVTMKISTKKHESSLCENIKSDVLFKYKIILQKSMVTDSSKQLWQEFFSNKNLHLEILNCHYLFYSA